MNRTCHQICNHRYVPHAHIKSGGITNAFLGHRVHRIHKIKINCFALLIKKTEKNKLEVLYIIEATSATSKGLRADSIELRQSITCTEHIENAILPHPYKIWTKNLKMMRHYFLG